MVVLSVDREGEVLLSVQPGWNILMLDGGHINGSI